MKIYQGNGVYGVPAYTIQNNKIYQGDGVYGVPAYTIKTTWYTVETVFMECLRLQ